MSERWPTIPERCRVAFMKQNKSLFSPVTGALCEQGVHARAFLRTGRTGDGKDQISPEQAARFDRAFEKLLGPTGIEFSPAGSNARIERRLVTVNRGRGSSHPWLAVPHPPFTRRS